MIPNSNPSAEWRVLVALGAIPLVGGTLLLAFLIAEGMGYHPLGADPRNVSEAAATGAAARAVTFIQNGQDPSERWDIAPGVLNSRAYSVTAIDAALLGKRPELIPVLLEYGARVTEMTRTRCLAHAVGLAAVLPLLGESQPAPEVRNNPNIEACFDVAR